LSLGRLHEDDLKEPTAMLHVARTLAARYADMIEFVPPYFNVSSS
jgi:hypothetical protein